jgi:NTE family protein
MRHFKNGCLALLLTVAISIKAQESKSPKIGLCLSGGGAKGLAHIGLLKLIDSLGIKVDYITGTSMGSVVGGLYAAGYTGNQIDSIAHTIDWDILLNQYVPMNEINSDEKDEYGRYIAEIPIKKGKVLLTGIIEGQELLNTLMRLTKHVNEIVDFNKLPIPFKCMAVDIVKVEPVVMDHGSLAIAMRASMSIPTVFKPTKVDNKLLVDGGLMVNFPVHQLKEMGADIIIGSYTGGRLMEESEMNTFNKLLVQSSSFYGINKAKDDISLCNVFNNLTDSMKQYGAGDFKKAFQIIEAGNTIARTVLPQLVKIAAKQKANGVLYEKKKFTQQNTYFKVEDIVIDPAFDKKMESFIMNRVTFKQGDLINFNDLENTVQRIYGTRNFFKVYYILEPQTNSNFIVKLKIEKDVKFRIKLALHYDSESGTGFIFNVTARNWLGKASRLTSTFDLSETPKFRIHYRKYIAQSNFSFNAEYLTERSFLQSKDSKGVINAADSYKDKYQSFNMGINYIINTPSSLYFGVGTEIDKLSPRFTIQNPLFLPGETSNLSEIITSNTTGLVGQFKFNTMNRFVFPNKGTNLFLESKLILIPLTKDEITYSSLDSSYILHEEQRSETTLYSPYNKLFLKINNLLPINNRVSVFTSFNLGLTYFNAVKFDTTSFHYSYAGYQTRDTPLNDYFLIGGVDGRTRQNFSSLWGLNEAEGIQHNFTTLRIGIQCEVTHKLFVTPAIAYLYTAATPKHFLKYIGKPSTNGVEYYPVSMTYSSPNYSYVGTDYDYVYSALITYGLNIGYRSPIGPINFNISKPSTDKYWRAYISIGYKF